MSKQSRNANMASSSAGLRYCQNTFADLLGKYPPEADPIMRQLSFAALLLLPLAPAFAQSDDFSGAWIASICPAGLQRDSGKCSSFVLELHQKDGKLCGAHSFATAGAERIDEGAAPSITGDIANGVAHATVVSTRAGRQTRVPVEMKKINGALQWQRLQTPPGDYLLPASSRLSKAKSKTLFAPVFEQELKAACSSAFAMADQEAAPPQPPAVPSSKP
jgi:hypothetical protein